MSSVYCLISSGLIIIEICLRVVFFLFFSFFLITSMFLACGRGSSDGASLEQLNARLHEAVRAANWELVDSCLNAGAEINAYSKSGVPTVIYAAQTGNPDFFKKLLKEGLDVRLNRLSDYRSTALMESAAVNDTTIGALLLKNGINVNAVDTFGDPAINWAAYYGHTAFARLLLQHGASMDISSKHGSALDVAMKQWQDDLVEFLISHGAGESLDSELAQKMVKAVKSNNLSMLQEVLSQGVSPDQKDEAGNPILVVAASRGYPDMVGTLLDAGADVDQLNRVGQTAISRAAYFGHYNIVRELISAGASVNEAGTQYNLTPLISAATGGQVETGRLLIDFGALVDDQDAINGFTPLMFATAYGHVDFVKLLIESKANPYIKSFDGAGLYDMVSFSNNKEIHEMLQQYLLQDD